MGNKTKVLFVVSEFYQAGTQRFAYELDRALNKKKFEVHILCILPLECSKTFKDYYYQKHLDLGTVITFLDDLKTPVIPSLLQRIKRKLLDASFPDANQKAIDFFNGFDCISIMGEYTFKEVDHYIKSNGRSKILIHIMNSKFQKSDLYVAFPKEENFHFVSGFDKNQIKWELEEFSSYRHTYYNLNLRFENEYVKDVCLDSLVPKIGIFTRLTYTKPLKPFLDAFKLIQKQIPDAELHLYGSGDPKEEGVLDYLASIQLESKVFFRGHQLNIIKTAVEDELDLVWLHGYHGVPGGWAGFDIATAKIPQLFWDFGAAPQTTYHSFFPMFKNAQQMAEQTIYFLKNPEKAIILVKQQFQYINENYNIEDNIAVMENLYIELKQSE